MNAKKKVKAGIVGVTGYTGEELLKILSRHPHAAVAALAGRSESERRHLKEIYPHLSHIDLCCEALDAGKMAKEVDVVFLALPHRVSFEIVPEFLKAKAKVIDLSADFRLKSAATYETWYGATHTAAHFLPHAVYGLPELHRSEVRKADLIANPGCYPTTIVLGLAPALKKGFLKLSSIIIDAKSGISGAGRKAVKEYFETEHPNLRPYNIAGGHRHIPEIEQELSTVAGADIRVTFTPHVIPLERGMLSTIYADLSTPLTSTEALDAYRKFYEGEPFVRILPEGKIPRIKDVAGTNYCDIGLKVDERTERLVVVSAIDNLVKGASGQAVQNMNVLFGLDEKDGLI